MDSREKVLALIGRVRGAGAQNEEQALVLQGLVAMAPLLVRLLPEDPAELDDYLRTIATFAAAQRSDDAPALGIFELVDGAWQPVGVEA